MNRPNLTERELERFLERQSYLDKIREDYTDKIYKVTEEEYFKTTDRYKKHTKELYEKIIELEKYIDFLESENDRIIKNSPVENNKEIDHLHYLFQVIDHLVQLSNGVNSKYQELHSQCMEAIQHICNYKEIEFTTQEQNKKTYLEIFYRATGTGPKSQPPVAFEDDFPHNEKK